MKFQSVLLAACFVLLGFALTTHKDKTTRPQKPISSKYPQEYMKQVSVWSYSLEGNLKNYLSADYWAYEPAQQASKLLKPHLTVYKPDASEWHIDAKRAHVLQPTLAMIEQVELQENVVLNRPKTAQVVPIRVETEVLRYRPHQETAETDQQITLIKPDLKITGLGMQADLKTNAVKLLENVQTQFVTTKQ